MSNKKYVKGIEELDMNIQLPVVTKDEFPQEAPALDYFNDNLQKEDTSRRDFLKVMGFSISAAALAASCKIPVKKAIPYTFKPEAVTPGKASYYASTFFDGREFGSILVKTREGRPIKVDGNPESPLTKGGSTSAMQASVLSLYDFHRFKSPMINGEAATWDTADADVKAALNGAGRKVLLTSSIISPSLKKTIQGLADKYNVEHVTYDAMSVSAMITANEKSFGHKAIPSYKLENADVIVSFAADFLCGWLDHITMNQGYVANRKINPENPTLSKHYQVESNMSLSGANADVRVPVKPSQQKAALFQLYNLLAGKVGGSAISGVPSEDLSNGELERMADDLVAARGKSVVLCGAHDEESQLVTNAINAMLGNIGSTIDFNRTLNTRQGVDEDFIQLVNDLNSGSVSTLLTYNANPAYNSPLAEEFATGAGKATVISFDCQPNETNALASHILPDNHYLESWGDAEPYSGSFSFQQPAIQPLFDTRQFGDSLLALADSEQSFYDVLQEEWAGKADWDEVIRNGFMHQAAVPAVSVSAGNATVSGISYSAPAVSGVELVLFEDKMGAGEHARNPYMQELPDPVSKVTWGNCAYVSSKYAKELGLFKDRNIKPGKKNHHVVRVTANGKSIELPLVVQPGVPTGVVAIPVGYGRTIEGLTGNETGESGFKLAAANGAGFSYTGTATVEGTGKMTRVAQTQLHHTIDDDRPVVKEATLADYKEKRNAGNYEKDVSEAYRKLVEDISLYPDRDFPGHHWGMNIDLNSCTGCGACVVSCNIENNIPIVGKEEVANGREMHWLRIDRYYATDIDGDKELENPSVVFMPMMCQMCDNAPCENVCPVNATNHSSEGLNQMAYNRCIGTRYCANNCPYKVRRFNWFDYWGADSWGPKNDHMHGKKEHVSEAMRNDLTRMILNPDVTVRSRGVIEKCSFCVQRIQEQKLDAKINGVAMDPSAIKTACQSACPTNAIVFGDMNNPDSELSKLNAEKRMYHVLEETHVLPSVSYMTKITNSAIAPFDKLDEGHFSEEHISHDKGHGGDHGDDHGDSHGADAAHGADHSSTEEHDNGH
ncbi:MAG: TAT-variant-translocated molybdopterin oxidoreductase [Saprospiraceae bacterium]|nr:TAT-variant-translocated molybdopterin oxidoreductase [Saprospiraceae bacterium]